MVNDKLNVDRKFYKWVRAILFNANTKGVKEAEKEFKVKYAYKAEPKFVILGWIQHIGAERGKTDLRYLALLHEFKRLFRFPQEKKYGQDSFY